MTIYRADLHIHTVLSPCAEVEMIPPLIVSTAIDAGLDMIGITDHNSAENTQAVVNAAEGTHLRVLPGLECETIEGVHLVCIFDTVSNAMEMQSIIYRHLPKMPNRKETFGAQFVVDSEGEFIRYNDRLLLAPTELTIKEVTAHALQLDSLVFPAHVDRTTYGIYSVLGFLPDSPNFDVLEISRHITEEQAKVKYPDIGKRLLLRSSDAHRLSELGDGSTLLDLKHRTVTSLKEMIAAK